MRKTLLQNNVDPLLIWQIFFSASKKWYSLADKNLSALGLSAGEFRVLFKLTELVSCPMAKLAGELFITKAGVTSLIDDLEKKGLVRRERDLNDRRIINLKITPRGRKLYEEALDLHKEFVSRSLYSLNPEDLSSILSIIQKLDKSLNRYEESTSS